MSFGLFMIRRRAMDGKRWFFLTKRGGWIQDPKKAIRFPDRKSALVHQGNRSGHVYWRSGL